MEYKQYNTYDRLVKFVDKLVKEENTQLLNYIPGATELTKKYLKEAEKLRQSYIKLAEKEMEKI